jgi:opacity protein-like surface antigen
MKKLIALTVMAALSHAAAAFAGPEMPSKEVVPQPPPPPLSYFRPNEFDIGAFGTYVTGTGDNPSATLFGPNGFRTTISGDTTIDGWGGGMDFTYWTPFKYLGFRFQGAAVSVSTGDFTVTTTGPGGVTARRSDSLSTTAGVISTDLMLRLPLDDFWPNVHLAPYGFFGLGALFVDTDSGTFNTPFPEVNARLNDVRRNLDSRVLGVAGGGFEYRFTPHIAIFGEAAYNFVDHRGSLDHNFIQTNFGLRYAF